MKLLVGVARIMGKQVYNDSKVKPVHKNKLIITHSDDFNCTFLITHCRYVDRMAEKGKHSDITYIAFWTLKRSSSSNIDKFLFSLPIA